MSVAEDRSHFSMWCILAAPLMAGNDLRKMTKETQSILTNKDVIAIDQDKAGIEGFKYSDKDSLEVWVKPLENNDWAICFLNRSSKPVKINFNWNNEIINDTLFNKMLDAKSTIYKIKNLWTKSNIGDTQKPFSATAPSHDVIVLRLSKQ
jgi:alpha-galactosidase